MQIIHNPRCRKSREALDILQSKGIDPEIRLYLNDVLSADELKDILKKLNIPAESLIRKNESYFKEKLKGKTLSEEEWISEMIKEPKLIERPIIIVKDKAVIARPPEKANEII
jgi:arsenate reductase